MYKAVIQIRRKDGMDEDEFLRYWREEHGPMAEDLEGLIKYTRGIALDTDAAEHDGVAELFFETKDDMKRALTSEVGQQLEADLANFTDPDYTVLLTEEIVEIDRT